LLDILTRNPAVWKKTIFILTYDENDGYFDHVPPFVAPHPRRANAGLVSQGIDTGVEYVEREQELKRRPADEARDSPIGLGYRVPMVIASPWTRGGRVCSQVFDHTSPLQFLEKFLTKKTGKEVREPNISEWRRTVCGDLTSAFQQYAGEAIESPPFPERNAFFGEIHSAQFKELPAYKRLTMAEIEQIQRAPQTSPLLPRQESGVRPSCALPYELAVDGTLADNREQFMIHFEARNHIFGKEAAGCPFIAYARHGVGKVQTRNYAVAAGDRLQDSWLLRDFAAGRYQIEVYGPNGFYRGFYGDTNDPVLTIELEYERGAGTTDSPNGNIELKLINRGDRNYEVVITDLAYKNGEQLVDLPAQANLSCAVSAQRSYGWYDVRVRVAGFEHFTKRYAGRVESGKNSVSDPAMGGAAG
jgi:phospholipase C